MFSIEGRGCRGDGAFGLLFFIRGTEAKMRGPGTQEAGERSVPLPWS